MAKKDSLSLQLEEILSEIPHQTKTAVEKAAVEAAKEAVKELKKTSPRLTGDYAKEWKYKLNQGGGVTIYNHKRYYLTHLLEHGHLIATGARAGQMVEPVVHIETVERKLEKRIPELVQKYLEEMQS